MGSGNINVNQGMLSFEGGASVTGTGTITVNPGGALAASNWASPVTLSENITLNGGTLQTDTNSANGNSTIASPINLAANSSVYVLGGSTLSLAGQISGSGILSVSSPGLLKLTGSNAFFSVPAFNGGNVDLSSAAGPSIPGNLAMNNAWVFVSQGNNQFGPTSVITFSTSNASSGYYNVLELDGNSQTVAGLVGGRTDGTSGFIENGQDRTGSGTSTLTVNTVNATDAFTFYGGIRDNVGAGMMAIAKSGPGLQVLAGFCPYTQGTTINGGTLQIGAGGNTGSLAAAATNTITDNGTLAFSRSDTQTYANTISGSGSVVQLGPGTLVLGGTSTGYAGSVAVTAGTLRLVTPGAMPACASPGLVSVAGGGTMSVAAGGSGWAGSDIGNLVTANGSGFAAGSWLVVDTTGGSVSVAASFGGGMGLAKIGANTLALAGTTSYSGPTAVLAGMLQAATPLPGCATPGQITVANGGTLTVAAGGSGWAGGDIGNLLSANGSGFASGSLLQIDTTAGGVNVGSSFSGNMALTTLGTNALVLSAANGAVGPITVGVPSGSGTLQLPAGGAIGSPAVSVAGTLAVNGGSLTVTGIGNPPDSLLAGTTAAPGAIYFSGGMLMVSATANPALAVASGPGASSWTQTGGTAVIVGQVNAGGTAATSSGSAQMTFSGGSFLQSGGKPFYLAPWCPATMTISGAANVSLNELIFGYSGTQAMTLNLNGGLLTVGSGGVAYQSGTATFSLNGGTLQAGGNFSVASNANLSTVVNPGGAIIDTQGYSVTVNSILLPGNGNGGLTKLGSGLLTLAAANTFTGVTTVSNGTLALGNSLALGQSTFDTSGAGTVSFGALTAGTLGGLQGPNNLTLNNSTTAAAAVALSVGTNGQNTTYSGSLGGGGALNKVGNGTLQLACEHLRRRNDRQQRRSASGQFRRPGQRLPHGQRRRPRPQRLQSRRPRAPGPDRYRDQQ